MSNPLQDPWKDEAFIDVTAGDKLVGGCVGFYALAEGTVEYVTLGGTTIAKTVAANTYHPIQIARFKNENTTLDETQLIAGFANDADINDPA